MGGLSRLKGVRGERDVERLITEAGIACDRSLGGREQGYLDIHTFSYPKLAIDVKQRKRLEIPKWCREAEEIVGTEDDHIIPTIAWRQDGDGTWRVSLRLVDLLWLLELQTMGRAA